MVLVGRFNDLSGSPAGKAGHTIGKARRLLDLDERPKVAGFVGRKAARVAKRFIAGPFGNLRPWRERTEG